MKNLCIRESYKNKNGEEKVKWNIIGVLFEANDKQYVKLNHIPGVLISVFEQQKKESPSEEAHGAGPDTGMEL